MDRRMFGLSFGELLIIAVLALLLLGPERLPEAAKTIGKSLRELRRVTDDLKDQVAQELNVDERRAELGALATGARGRPNEPPPPATAQNVPGLEAALAEPGPASAQRGGNAPASTPPAPPEKS